MNESNEGKKTDFTKAFKDGFNSGRDTGRKFGQNHKGKITLLVGAALGIGGMVAAKTIQARRNG